MTSHQQPPRCWWCGVEPTDTHEIYSPNGNYHIHTWPPADHQHSVTPPTTDQLVADGHATLRRIMERM